MARHQEPQIKPGDMQINLQARKAQSDRQILMDLEYMRYAKEIRADSIRSY